MVFHWSLSNSKSPQVSRTLLGILAVLNNVVVRMVSIRTPASKSSSPFSNPFIINIIIIIRGCPPLGVMVKAMDCGIVVSEFVLQSRYYVHFRANTLGKGMNPLILPAMG